MAGIVKAIKKRLKSAFGFADRGKQLRNLEERQSRPTKAERVVVRPSRPVKKRVKNQ